MVKVGFSFTDMKGTLNNIEAEILYWNRKQLEQCWQNQLSKLIVKGDNKEDKEKFYGALYRSSYLMM